MPSRSKTMCRRPNCGKAIAKPGYCEQHSSYRSGWVHRSRASNTERGYGWAWRLLREQILERDRGLCQPCLRNGKIQPASEVDHIVAKICGGCDDDTNLQAICQACHKRKTAHDRQRGGGGRRSNCFDTQP